MSTQGPIVMTATNPLDSEGVVSNVATERAAEEALRSANVDGKDIYPNTVRTRHFSAETMFLTDGSFISDGVIRANHLVTTENIITTTLQVGNNLITEDQITVPNLSSLSANLGTITAGDINGVTITLGDGSNGFFISPDLMWAKSGGDIKMSMDVLSDTYLFSGEVVAEKITIIGNPQNDVEFDADVKIGGNIIMTSVDTDSTLYWGEPPNEWAFLGYQTGRMYFNVDKSGANISMTAMYGSNYSYFELSASAGIQLFTTYGDTYIGAASSILLSAQNVSLSGGGELTVDTLTLSGGSISGAYSVTAGGGGFSTSGTVAASSIYAGEVKGVHKTTSGSYKQNTVIHFYAASTSGGAANVYHSVTFTDGLITSWAAN